ncbi:hypothetical protein C8Q76DRAFT_851829 [Earliella scabrosa]|nr:hypothetical protein C8Q76DRAFT_851829 [Earliella scabrosa]
MTLSLSLLPPQILKLICDQCDTNSLLALNTTCHLLFKHAAARIWHTLSGFAELVYTLPRDAWTSELSDKGYRPYERNLFITRELSDRDLTRFRVYAPFVHEVTGRSPQYVQNHNCFWDVLGRVLKPGCLPNLCRVTMGIHWEPIYLFIAPRLQKLTVHTSNFTREGHDTADWTVNLLIELARNSTSIRTFEITGDASPSDVDISGLLADAIINMPLLQTFRSLRHVPLLPRAFHHLASLPDLQIVEFHVNSAHYPHDVPSAYAESNSFPRLTAVTVSADTGAWCVSFVKAIRSRFLRKITFDAPQQPTTSIYKNIFASLAEHPSNDTLNDLTIDFGSWSTPVALSPDTISLLFRLRSLEYLYLGGDCQVTLDDRAIASMADAWPQLRDAVFENWDCSQMASTMPLPTLSGLAVLVEKCPHLTTLSLDLADVVADDLPAMPEQRPLGTGAIGPTTRPPCELLALGVGAARLAEADVLPVAALLSLWFPSLCNVTVASYDTWYQIPDLVSSFATVRKQERRWALRHNRPEAPAD